MCDERLPKRLFHGDFATEGLHTKLTVSSLKPAHRLTSSFGDIQSVVSWANELLDPCIPDQEKALLGISGCQPEEADNSKYPWTRLLSNGQRSKLSTESTLPAWLPQFLECVFGHDATSPSPRRSARTVHMFDQSSSMVVNAGLCVLIRQYVSTCRALVMSAAAAATAPAPPKAHKAKKAKVPASHPPVFDMIKAAIVAHKDKKGTSLPTIKRHISEHYKVDMVKLTPHIRRVLVSHVANGSLIRVGNKGQGASGSFKLGEKAVKAPKVHKAPKAAKAAKPKKASEKPKKVKKPKSAAKKPKTPKKAAAKKPKVVKAKTPKKSKPAAMPKVHKAKPPKKPVAKKPVKA
ncbi:nucleosome positioning [Sparganum proliferum]